MLMVVVSVMWFVENWAKELTRPTDWRDERTAKSTGDTVLLAAINDGP
jgi:hypothetical protein